MNEPPADDEIRARFAVAAAARASSNLRPYPSTADGLAARPRALFERLFAEAGLCVTDAQLDRLVNAAVSAGVAIVRIA